MDKFLVLLVVGAAAVFQVCSAVRIRCPRNEVLDKCKNPCLPSCNEPDRLPCPTFTCSAGCVCRKGLIRNDVTGKCIPMSLCPSVCNGTNEVFTDCGSGCAPTCQTPCKEPIFCPAVCERMCVCRKGFTRDETTQQCIPTEKCPECDCGEDKVYTRCGALCVQTCQNIENPPFCSAAQGCKAGCICKEGLILDEVSGKCVPREQCKSA